MDERTSHRVLFCAERFHNLIVFLQSGTFMLIVHEKKAILKSRCRLPIRQIVLIDSDINENLPIHWQLGYYHITMAFIDETHCVDDIKYITCK